MLVLVIRTLILYSTVVLSLRIMGKRQIGEMQPSELVVAIMISDLAAIPMQAIDLPLLAGIVPVLTLVITEVIMSYISLKSATIRRFITGEPSVVIYNGHINEKELKKLRFNMNDLLEELRANNFYDIADVAFAVLETNGKLSIVPKDTSRPVTVEDLNIKNPKHSSLPFTLIMDGEINQAEMTRCGRNNAWLENELKKRGIDSIKDVLLASMSGDNTLYIQKKGEEDKGV